LKTGWGVDKSSVPTSESELVMAGGWAKDGAEQEQIDDTVEDALQRVRSEIPTGDSLTECE